jgi:hypothetical protein
MSSKKCSTSAAEEAKAMIAIIGTVAGIVASLVASAAASEPQAKSAQDALDGVRSVRIERISTRVPSPGKLAAIRITDSGRIYYICREGNGYAIYHLEIRPVEGFKDKIAEEVKAISEKWDAILKDQLVFTKDTRDEELRKRVQRYSEAVWVRNEIIVEGTAQDKK